MQMPQHPQHDLYNNPLKGLRIMKKTIKISRSASGSGTIVTVTILEDGIQVSYAYKSSAMRIGESVDMATKACREMLAQAREAVDRGES